MHDSFYFSSEIKNFLFKNVCTNTLWGMMSLCFGIASLSLLIEVLKSSHKICFGSVFKITRRSDKTATHHRRLSSQFIPIRDIIASHPHWPYKKVRNCVTNGACSRFCGTILYILIVLMNYILMLAVMSFNANIAIAAVCGSGIGYLCFNFLNTAPYFASYATCNDTPSGNFSGKDTGDERTSFLNSDSVEQENGSHAETNSTQLQVEVEVHNSKDVHSL